MKTLSLILAALLSCPVSAFADVTISHISTSGGFRGMGASESKGTRYMSGVKSREDDDMRYTGAILGRIGGKKKLANILRVDLDKRWSLNLKKKTYTESPIKFEIPEAADEDEAPEKDAKTGQEEKPTHRIKSAKASVKNTGETKKINGFKTARWTASLIIVVEEIATKETAEYAMSSDVWATPWTKDLRAAMNEEARFAKAYLKKLGVDLSPQEKNRFGLDKAKLLLASAGPEVEKAVKKLAREMSSIDGYPIVTESTWRAPAPPAEKAKQEPEDDDGALSDAAGAGSIGGAAMGMLGGFAKRAAKKKAKKAMTPDSGKPAFSVRTEVKSVSVGAIPAETFKVPAGFKKKG